MLLVLVPFASAASEDRASKLAEKKLWAYSEKIALALPGDGRDVSALAFPSDRSGMASENSEQHASATEIGPSLAAVNTVVVIAKNAQADSVSFELKGSCVPFKSLRSRYPSLLVLDYPRDESVLARHTFGALVGDSIIAYSFPAAQSGCMNHVEVSLAASITAKTVGSAGGSGSVGRKTTADGGGRHGNE
ncbi:hypothetical protein [Stenotrophomonas sp.]|uniref:hypothetical protein n=1 Tax=Stenotrophomonas sp. TaxID=69392 RepID=UPI0028ACA92C|nr:hypothetical protein [Stenotrophomonas sp.]